MALFAVDPASTTGGQDVNQDQIARGPRTDREMLLSFHLMDIFVLPLLPTWLWPRNELLCGTWKTPISRSAGSRLCFKHGTSKISGDRLRVFVN